ncbi:OmpA family protein [Ascidiaceihabitans sp.]|uniref:OmpA family protein n=1 Tax=Ascidiaceihabitans sp. TaxID=1872644 RepID=UPI0032988764
MALWDNASFMRVEKWGVVRKALFGVAAIGSLVGVPIMFVVVIAKNEAMLTPTSPYQPEDAAFIASDVRPEIDCVAALDTYVADKEIYFRTNSATIDVPYHYFVLAVNERLNDCPNAEVFLMGHADGTGSDPLNTDISLRRAEAFLSVLVAHGKSPTRYRTFGQGARESVLLGDSGTDDQKLNRRLELEVKYIDKTLRP